MDNCSIYATFLGNIIVWTNATRGISDEQCISRRCFGGIEFGIGSY